MTPKHTPVAKPRLILIVDDEEALANALSMKFKKNGFNPTVCSNGKVALKAMAKEKYDVILLDLLMPEMDGFEVLRRKPETLNAETPAYVLTVLGQDEHLEQAKTLGAKRCYIKSMTPVADVLKEIKEDLGIA